MNRISTQDPERHLAAVAEEIQEIFNDLPVESQPTALVDLDCGDGIVLRRVLETIRERTARGSCLERHPIAVAGIASGPQLLAKARTEVASFGARLRLRQEQSPLENVIESLGVVGQRLLFLNLRGAPPRNLGIHNASSWLELLRSFAQNLGAGKLLTLCSHSGRQNRSSLNAAALMESAASAGLFNDRTARRFLSESGICQASLHCFAKRDYRIRHAVEGDLQRLCELEERCWRHTRTPASRIVARLRYYPQGQFVLEAGGVVAGVLYSQRIASLKDLERHTAADVHELLDPAGAVVQLLAINVDPAAQDSGYGDRLLEFMLQRCSMMDAVKQVAGITLCKQFRAAGGLSFEEYITQEGPRQDPVLNFHGSHGAAIVKAVPGYRPEDETNLGNGVLVTYDLAARRDRLSSNAPKSGESGTFQDRTALETFLRAEIAATLRGVEIDLDRPLMELGLDSAELMQLQHGLEQAAGLRLGAAFFFQHNTVRKVVAELAGRLGLPDARDQMGGGAPAAIERRAAGEESCRDIAIIGMACRLPGGIESPGEFWNALAEGQCLIGKYPTSRGKWACSEKRPGIDRGGFVSGLEYFDAPFFRMSAAEAQRTDPQQRMLLEVAWACMEDAGIACSELKGAKTGVFVGASNWDYSRLIQDAGTEVEAHQGVGNALSILANRLSYFFDLNGPSLLLDTACSSSLVAVHAAVQSLRSGECSAAIVAGVNAICHPHLSIAYYEAGMLSPDGLCRTFDAKANGYVRAEGAVALLLKRLDRAIENGDRIHAVIKGSAINHGGLAGGLTVPNPDKQADLLLAAWNDAGIDAEQLSYIEAHGTGTRLGDPIEVQGIRSAFERGGGGDGRARQCGIGSVKTNLGHLESAAGIAGLLKLVISLQHRRIPANIHFSEQNPKLDLTGTRLSIQSRETEWNTNGEARIAGVSSFGSGGANAHAVVQEYAETGRPRLAHEGEMLFVLSAATEDRLREYVARVVAWLDDRGDAVRFEDAIFTWQTGRVAMKYRLAARTSGVADLRLKLGGWLAGKSTGVITGAARVDGFEVEGALGARDLEQLADLWVRGASVDWRRLYGAEASRWPRRLSLPTYPFARERYWIDAGAAAVLHENVLFTPRWKAEEPETSAAVCAESRVIVVGLPALDFPGAVRVLADSGSGAAETFMGYARACFETLRAILRDKPRGRVVVQIVAPGDGENIVNAGLSGLLRTLMAESPQIAAQLILIDGTDADAATVSRWLERERASAPDVLVRYVSGERQAQRWNRVEAPAAGVTAWRESGVYLITGGMGGLGHMFAQDVLARTQTGRVVLSGRSEMDVQRAHALESLGPRASYVRADVGDTNQVQQLIATILGEHGRLDGILHCAGVLADSLLIRKTAEQFDRVLAPKVRGASLLDEATAALELDFFVLFSSIMAVTGNIGQADYATANGFLDWFATYRNALVAAAQRHGRTVAIDWPLWRDGGMGVDDGALAMLDQLSGLQPLTTRDGLELFHSAMCLPVDRVLIATGDKGRIGSYFNKLRLTSNEPTNHRKATPAGGGGQLIEQVKSLVAMVLEIPAAGIDVRQPFVEYGLDSLFGAKLIVKINERFGTRLAHIALFEYPTISEFCAFLETELAPALRQPEVSAGATDSKIARAEPIAVIGMSGRYPGAPDLARYWHNLKNGINSVAEIPQRRWDIARFYDADRGNRDTSYSKWLGAVDDIECFDPQFFRISPSEAEYMDPQHRLLLEESYHAFEDAGYAGPSLANTNCGVYLGITTNDYFSLVSRSGAPPITSNHAAIAAGRISYYLNLKGPAITIDTACSSSLVAVHLACQALLSGEVEMALAGGATLWMGPEQFVAMSQAGMFSPTGQCRTFDESADGIVNADGVGVVVLKTLRRAETDGDAIYAVIPGSAINQDGATNGITAPSVRSQVDLISQLYSRRGIDPETIGYVEAHGTGTRLGDPIELEALSTAFRQKTQRKQFCGLGSVKSNIGHTTAAAGVAGLHKVLLSLQHRTLAATLNARNPTSRFDFANSPFYLTRQTREWAAFDNAPRRAAVSSFGFSGTNAHLVVEEYRREEHAAVQAASLCAVPLSARKEEQLRQVARDLLAFLHANPSACLRDLAYTLQVGRDAREERIAFIVDSVGGLRERLREYLNGNDPIENSWRGRRKHGDSLSWFHSDAGLQAALELWVSDAEFSRFLPLWARGLDFDWRKLYSTSAEPTPRRIHLPTYPFAKERYWIAAAPAPSKQTVPVAVPESARWTPAVERNTPALEAASRVAACLHGIENTLLDVVAAQFYNLGLTNAQTASVAARYRQWVDETAALLRQAGRLRNRLDEQAIAQAWAHWRAAKDEAQPDADLAPYVGLLDAAVCSLSDVLTGKRAATAVLFPDSSLGLVRGIYAGNSLAAYYNEVLANTIASYVEFQQRRESNGPVRILEVGAGTGGTTAAVLRKIRDYRSQIEEYCYTDVSKAFLLHGEQAFGGEYPFVTFRVLNAENALSPGDMAQGRYDVVIATNALHATRRIRETLNNIKALLRPSGILLLNEMADKSLFTHLTFGLLEGWWLPEDTNLRVSGSPALTPETWRSVLEQEGFRSVAFPAAIAHSLGQQVVVAFNGASGQAHAEAAGPSQSPADFKSRILNFLEDTVSQGMKIPLADVDPDAELSLIGYDSITLTGFSKSLNDSLGLDLTPSVFFGYPTLRGLAEHLCEKYEAALQQRFQSWRVDPEPRQTVPVRRLNAVPEMGAGARPQSGESDRRVAIIGMSGCFPKATDIDGLWRNLVEGRDCISEIPKNRWPLNELHGDASQKLPGVKWGGFVEEIDQFDPLFFGISPGEAELMDPQQRLLMTYVWKAIEDAGYSPQRLHGSNTALLAGTINSGYGEAVNRCEGRSKGESSTGTVPSIGPNRVSYLLNLHGPSEPIETACSSSLVAIHRGRQLIESGQCEIVIAGGVNALVSPESQLSFGRAGFLSEDGRCKSFSAQANGYVRSEGAGFLVLKSLRAAERDGDHIYGVVIGSAENHGGRAASLTAPNPKAQAEVIAAAYDQAGIDCRTVTYIEAHGTGTPLGDPIEIEGLKRAFGATSGESEAHCGLGSIKSNLGHMELAAGVAGVIKVLLQLRHKTLVRSLHCEQVNPYLHLEGSPFYLVRENQPWVAAVGQRGQALPRRAGVSSFGFGGVNAHVLLEEYEATADAVCNRRNGPALVVLSARSEDRLLEQARQLARAVREQLWSDERLADLAYTLQVGREGMEHRIAMAVGNMGGLVEKLEAYVAGRQTIEDFHRGEVRRNKEVVAAFKGDQELQDAVAKWMERGKYSKLLALWAKGLEVDWTRLYKDAKPRRMALPSYPFARERYWIEAGVARREKTHGVAALHPLVHVNVSDFSAQRYRSSFTGEEFFLADHVVNGEKMLPGVAYLEMVRAAIADATGTRSADSVLELRNTVWARPFVLTQQKELSVALSPADDEEIEYRVYSGHSGEATIHCEGRAHWVARKECPWVDVNGVSETKDVAPVYERFRRRGVQYGPAFLSLHSLDRSAGKVVARLQIPAPADDTFVLHPSLLDGALQACLELIDGNEEASTARLPFALEKLRVIGPCTPAMVAVGRFSPGSHSGDSVVKVDIDLCDARGEVCVELRGLSTREVAARADTGLLFLAPQWREQAIAVEAVRWGACEVLHCEHSGDVTEIYEYYARACYQRLRAILESKPRERVLLQVEAPATGQSQVLAGLSGLLRSAHLENPLVSGQVVLLGGATSAQQTANLLEHERMTSAPEALVSYENGWREVLRWEAVESASVEPPIAWRKDGVYLITGGLGGVGVLVAREILDRAPDARVALCGRSKLDAVSERKLRSLGPNASYRQADVSVREQAERLIDSISSEYGRLKGVLHCAGVLHDGFLLCKTEAEFDEVLAPKVRGAFYLDEATRELELDCFVLFSSIAGALGNVGQGDYAAANGFLDWFAEYRNGQVTAGERHGRTVSLAWPLWRDGGMKVDEETERRLEQLTGLQSLDTATAMQGLYRSLELGSSRVLIGCGGKARMQRLLIERLHALQEAPHVEASAPARGDARHTASTIQERAKQYLREQFSGLLKLPAARIDSEAPLETYGIDSILAIRLTNKLEESFGSLPKTLFFEYRSLAELAEYLIEQHGGRLETALQPPAGAPKTTLEHAPALQAKTPALQMRPSIRRRASTADTAAEPIAIVGLSGRYPGACDIDAFWSNLRAGADSIVQVPPERWDWREYYSEDRTKEGHHFSKWGGFIDGVDEFDPLFFNISPKEADYIDPQERLFLQHAWQALEDAGYTRAALQRPQEDDLPAQVGVYAGFWTTEYQMFGAEAGARGHRVGVAGSPSGIANRVSYFMNLHGPSYSVDTMCSSSLTAIHLACQDLRNGRTQAAIAGGVNVNIHANKYLLLSGLQAISTAGRCQAFGEGGDGYIPSEGVGVAVLKRLSDAERDGDRIYGVIRGSALNHGGKTNGYTVPNPQAQTAAIRRALREAGVPARRIGYIEAHGTGTKLGDPIEIAALTKAFDSGETGFCRIGSVKSNIGHCESAAGIAGLTKVLLQMQHGELAPSLHAERLNPHIDFERTPFVVNRALQAWEAPEEEGRTLPRLAGISSFGAGGSNAHLIVEEYVEAKRGRIELPQVALPLSARTAEQLRQRAQDLREYLEQEPEADLAAVGYTLQVGREGMEERLAFTASSVEEARCKLEAFLSRGEDADGVLRGQARRGREALGAFTSDPDFQQTVERWITAGKLGKLLELWTRGLEIDWEKLYNGAKPHRIALPGYPFARERYWIPEAETSAEAKGTGAGQWLHPLLEANTSDLSEQRFSSRFTGEEFFFRDHRVNGEKALPAAAYLEMARAAIAQASPERGGNPVSVQLKNIIWIRPLIANGDLAEVHITIHPAGRDEVEFEVYRQTQTGDSSERLLYCQGRGVLPHAAQPAGTLNVPALHKECCAAVLSGEECYRAFDAEGLTYGPAHRAMDSLHISAGDTRQALAKLTLPHAVAQDGFLLHPSIVDAALQSTMGLTLHSGARLPFSLEKLEALAPCPRNAWAWVRYDESGRDLIDVDICDEAGTICASLRGLAGRPAKRPDRAESQNAPEPELGNVYLAPVWDVAPLERFPIVVRDTRLLIIGGSQSEKAAVRKLFPQAVALETETPHDIASQLAECGPLEQLLWIAAENDASESPQVEACTEQPIFGFRLIKALLELGYGGKKLTWTIITRQSQQVHADAAVNPAHAGIHGLVGSLAKEYPNWSIRLVDLEVSAECPWEEVFTLPTDSEGDAWARRKREWFRQKLAPCTLTGQRSGVFRRGGVYVVIGGAGGIGQVFSQHLVRNYQAHVVWVGRRSKDGAIDDKARSMAAFGPAPEYFRADATDAAQLREALLFARMRFGAVHGVVHSALELLDKSLWNMDEERFRRVLAAKIDVSVSMAEALRGSDLDFAMFFSSIQSFTKRPGQSNYAAACAFLDSYAAHLANTMPFRVRVINWGYWGGVGVVSGEDYRERMREAGFDSIEAHEGIAAIEHLLAGPFPQIVHVKILRRDAMPRVDFGQRINMAAAEAPSVLFMSDERQAELATSAYAH